MISLLSIGGSVVCIIAFGLFKMLQSEIKRRRAAEERFKKAERELDDIYTAKKIRENVLGDPAAVSKLRNKYQRD